MVHSDDEHPFVEVVKMLLKRYKFDPDEPYLMMPKEPVDKFVKVRSSSLLNFPELINAYRNVGLKCVIF